MDIIHARTALKIKEATATTMELIQLTMKDPEEFINCGYWNVADVFNPQSHQLIADLGETDAKAMRDWITSWLSTYGWVLDANNHISACNFD